MGKVKALYMEAEDQMEIILGRKPTQDEIEIRFNLLLAQLKPKEKQETKEELETNG